MIRRMVGQPRYVALACGLVGLWLGSVPAVSADSFFCSPQGSGAGECDAPSSVGVVAENGDVFVADERSDAAIAHQNNRVDVFAADGSFLSAFGWDVIPAGEVGDSGAGLETCTALSGCKAGSAGAGLGQFTRPSGIAVDNSCARHNPPLSESTSPTCGEFDPANGDVYVFDRGVERLQRFHSNGAFVERVFPASFDENAKVAIGPDGAVFVGDRNAVRKFDSEGNLLKECNEITTGNFTDIAVEDNGSFWSVNRDKVRKYDAACNLLTTIEPSGAGNFNISAIALDAAGQLFVGDHTKPNEGGQTAIYEYSSAGTPIHVLYGNGTLQGNPLSLAYFHNSDGDLFAVDGASPRRVVHIAIEPPGPVVLPFAGQVGPSQGSPEGTRATEVGNLRATLRARVNPEGKSTEVHYEYVDRAAYDKDKGEGGDGFGEAFVSEASKTTPSSIPANFTSQSDNKPIDTSFAVSLPRTERGTGEKGRRRQMPESRNRIPLPRGGHQLRRALWAKGPGSELHDPATGPARPGLGDRSKR